MLVFYEFLKLAHIQQILYTSKQMLALSKGQPSPKYVEKSSICDK